MQANESASESATDRSLVLSRVFDAPPRIVFEAHSKPELVMKWFGPKGWPLTSCEMDFREGGAFRFQMTGPDGKAGPPFGGTYLVIEKDRKIVYDNGFLVGDTEKMVVTVTLEPLDGEKTRFTMRTVFATLAMKNQHLAMGFEQGVGSGLEQLGDVVVALRTRPA